MVRLMESGDVFGHAAAVRCIFECDVGEQHKCECLILDPVLRALPSVGREEGGERGPSRVSTTARITALFTALSASVG